MHLSVIVCQRGMALAIANLPTKFEISTSIHYEGMKGGTKCRKWCGLG